MSNKKEQATELSVVGVEQENAPIINAENIEIDEEAIAAKEKEVEELKEELKDKEYSLKTTKEIFEYLRQYIEDDLEWQGKEGKGVLELCKVLDAIKKEGIKDGYVYMPKLAMQGFHYFLSRKIMTGRKEAEKFVEVYNVFDEALGRANDDQKKLGKLEVELKALQQGLKAE